MPNRGALLMPWDSMRYPTAMRRPPAAVRQRVGSAQAKRWAQDRPHELLVQATAGRGQGSLPLRLIILRKTAEATEATRLALHRRAPRKQKVLDPRSLVAAEFLILATSLPAERYPADEVLAAYRLRWQIELAFKRLKSLIHIDNLPTRTPAAGRSWLYAHLILALLCDDISQDFLESSP